MGCRCICPASLRSTFIDHHADNFLVCGRTDLWHISKLYGVAWHAGHAVLGCFLHKRGLGRLRGLRWTWSCFKVRKVFQFIKIKYPYSSKRFMEIFPFFPFRWKFPDDFENKSIVLLINQSELSYRSYRCENFYKIHFKGISKSPQFLFGNFLFRRFIQSDSTIFVVAERNFLIVGKQESSQKFHYIKEIIIK